MTTSQRPGVRREIGSKSARTPAERRLTSSPGSTTSRRPPFVTHTAEVMDMAVSVSVPEADSLEGTAVAPALPEAVACLPTSAA
jgi:hypothetical protein